MPAKMFPGQCFPQEVFVEVRYIVYIFAAILNSGTMLSRFILFALWKATCDHFLFVGIVW